MRLPGRLESTTLGDLLGVMHRARASGVLELVEVDGATAGRRHRITLEAGLVAAVDTALRVARVGEILRSQGFVGDDTVRLLARKVVEKPAARIGEILVDDVKLSPSLLSAALRRQLRLKLDALFALRSASVRFHVARPRDPERAPPLSPREFLHGRPRARDVRGASAEPRRGEPSGKARARAHALGVLGLGPSANRDAVQRAFRTLAARVHPDRHPGASASERADLLKQFSALSAAYHLLVA